MKAIEIFKSPLTKQQQADVIENSVNLILSGEINPIQAEITLKAMETVIEAIRKNQQVKSLTLEETAKYGKSFEYMGAKIENAQRTVFDFSECGDEIYNDLKEQEKKLKEQIKIREQIIKSGVDTSTGVCFNPPQTSITEFLKITFVK